MTDTWPYLDAHQTRDHEPTPYELKLAPTLEEVFTHDGHELADVVAGSTPARSAPRRRPWTEESFRAEMNRLGA